MAKEIVIYPYTAILFSHKKEWYWYMLQCRWISDTTATAKSKHNHNLTPSQININPDTKGLFTLVSFTYYIMCSFQQKITRYAKRQKTQFGETKPALEQNLAMAEMLEVSEWEFKTIMENRSFWHILLCPPESILPLVIKAPGFSGTHPSPQLRIMFASLPCS